MSRIRNLVALTALVLQACGDAFGPAHTNVDEAHADWLANRSASYTFELTQRGSWFPERHYRVTVENHQVVERIEIDSVPRPPDVVNVRGLTIDDIWEDVLRARGQDRVNDVRFDQRGIPLVADLGHWEVDGGRSYHVRNYRPR